MSAAQQQQQVLVRLRANHTLATWLWTMVATLLPWCSLALLYDEETLQLLVEGRWFKRHEHAYPEYVNFARLDKKWN